MPKSSKKWSINRHVFVRLFPLNPQTGQERGGSWCWFRYQVGHTLPGYEHSISTAACSGHIADSAIHTEYQYSTHILDVLLAFSALCGDIVPVEHGLGAAEVLGSFYASDLADATRPRQLGQGSRLQR